MVFYNNYIRFCAKVGKSPSAVAEEIGLYKSTVTNWKNRGTKPTDATLQRVADYFGVTVEDLLEENRKPAPEIRNGAEEEFVKLFEKLPRETQERELAYLRELVEKMKQDG